KRIQETDAASASKRNCSEDLSRPPRLQRNGGQGRTEPSTVAPMRTDGRIHSQLRPVRITPHVSDYAEGSALIEFGKTKVLCTASYEPMAPKWLQGTGPGWITAEYGMLPRSTQQRLRRDKTLTGGRTQEI